MDIRTLALLLAVIVPTAGPQAQRAASPAVDQHIHELISSLPRNSDLRSALLQGPRGDGVHFAWMDDMRKAGVKRVEMWVDIHFDRHGRPKRLTLGHTWYFDQYAGNVPVSNAEQLKEIRASGLQDELIKLALKRAEHGVWLDIPSPRPHPFVGGAMVTFFDDEWLPELPLLYYVGTPNIQETPSLF